MTISPYQHGVRQSAMAQGTHLEVLLAFLGLLVEPAFQPDAPFTALDGWLWPRGIAGFAMQGIDEWSVVDTNTGA
jgi:hypothetical protein